MGKGVYATGTGALMKTRGQAAPLRAERAYPCPECGTWMQVTHNPSYGSGLAVHPYILLCDRCGWTNFLPAAPAERIEPAIKRRGFFSRLFGRRDKR